jgi:hypothetical protein
MSMITRSRIARARRLIAEDSSIYLIAAELRVPTAEARAIVRAARAGLRYGEPAPVVLDDDAIRARQAERKAAA